MPDLVIVIPSRGRPENIRKVISAWDFTNAWDVADMVVAVDADDPEIGGYLALFEETKLPGDADEPDTPLFSLVTLTEWVPMVHKLDKVARNLAFARKYKAIGFAGDDHLPRTINWAQTYLAQLAELETGLVHSDDGYQGANICTEWAVTTDVVTTLERMIPAPVEHMYSDVSLHDLMSAAGALRYLPQVRIEHMHPIVKKAETDEQYQRVNSRDQFARDKAIYDSWKNGRFSEQLAAIKALRPDRPVPAARERRAPTRRGRDVMRSKPSTGRTRYPWPSSFKQIRGATPDEIMMTMADLAAVVPADQVIVELGVFQAKTTLIMAWGASQGHGAHVAGVDAWDLDGNTYGPPFNTADSENWARYWVRTLGYGDRVTLVKNFASDAAASWPLQEDTTDTIKQIGLLFVDDDHSYEGARRAVEDWAPHLADGAVIAIDDYGHPDWPGVQMAVEDLVQEGILAPVTVYHDRLAVTRLGRGSHTTTGTQPVDAPPAAITSEGISPSPYPAMDDQVADGSASMVLGAHADVEVSIPDEVAPDRSVVWDGELEDALVGKPLADLNMTQLRAVGKARGFRFSTGKGRSDILAAITG